MSELIPAMLESFLASDRVFVRASETLLVTRKAQKSSELVLGTDLRPISVRVPIAVQLTGISRTKLYELMKSGEIEVIKLGSVTLIPIDSLQRFIDANRT